MPLFLQDYKKLTTHCTKASEWSQLTGRYGNGHNFTQKISVGTCPPFSLVYPSFSVKLKFREVVKPSRPRFLKGTNIKEKAAKCRGGYITSDSDVFFEVQSFSSLHVHQVAIDNFFPVLFTCIKKKRLLELGRCCEVTKCKEMLKVRNVRSVKKWCIGKKGM